MHDALFTYGTLQPGRENAHLLEAIGGTFQPATARGWLYPRGIGLTLGYPALIPDPAAPPVPGHLFTSPLLASHWQALDNFEGPGYVRTLIPVTLPSRGTIQAFIYAYDCPQP
jgi:gamma-glutamylcyclotransferase (GGCT)/AIG2-like uncharacterized protein YtfP